MVVVDQWCAWCRCKWWFAWECTDQTGDGETQLMESVMKKMGRNRGMGEQAGRSLGFVPRACLSGQSLEGRIGSVTRELSKTAPPKRGLVPLTPCIRRFGGGQQPTKFPSMRPTLAF